MCIFAGMSSSFLISAPHSGAGKTTLTLGLLHALQRRGLVVQPFKCGPDYIDPIHHRTASGRDSINLDRYMMTDQHIQELYHRHGQDADICITEGVMGLFDGAVKSEGSSADLASLLGLPVILILNAKAMAYSAAAILYGLKNYDPALRIAGVIFNFVSSASHYSILQDACKDIGLNALGHLPEQPLLKIPSRHLGLDTAEATAAIAAAGDHVERHLDLELLLRSTERAPARFAAGGSLTDVEGARPEESLAKAYRSLQPARRKVLIAKDEAFHFLYPENIRRLSQWGEIHYFSPIHDAHLPFIPDLLYFPGGYPELYLSALAANQTLLGEIRGYAGKLLAECGGMMYLGQTITDADGRDYSMAGVLDVHTSMAIRKLSMGYRCLKLSDQELRGHEFHYSQFSGPVRGDSSFEVFNARNQRIEAPVFYTQQLFASYMHFYWGEDNNAVAGRGLIHSWLD